MTDKRPITKRFRGAYPLSLKEIASWEVSALGPSQIVARPPSLQRGLVWETSQIELLWDSILRGFPIGSFVLCEPLKGQERRRPKRVRDQRVTHHLLDGQQRGYAITLGFSDPFERSTAVTPVLWLD